MSEKLKNKINWNPKSGSMLRPYLKPINPLINESRLVMDLLEGSERDFIKRTHTTGDFSLLLSYKNTPAMITSFEINKKDIVLLQLQGVKGRTDYRVSNGVDYIRLFADTIINIITNPSLSFERLVMPSPWSIPGIVSELGEIQGDFTKYAKFAAIAGLNMSSSNDNNYYIRIF